MTTTIEITERALPVLRSLRASLQNRAADAPIGQAVTKLIQDHFHALPPNRQNFPTTHFWQRTAEATTFALTDGGVRIDINQIGIRQRLLGGVINPVNAKCLAIPATAEAYGHVPADFDHLKIARAAFSGHTALALVPESATSSQPADPGSVFFWLVKSVVQFPDPEILPSDEDCLAAAETAFAQTLK